jgi:flagellar basal-body rod protein FlgB
MENNIVTKAVIAKTSIPTLKRQLDLASLRQKITAGNMANVGTPGYKRRMVNFDAELKKLVQPERLTGVRTHSNHIPVGDHKDDPFRVKADPAGQTNGVNNVDVETEMAALAETQIWYQLGTTLTQKKFSGLRLAIKGER